MFTQKEQVSEIDAQTSVAYRKQFWKAGLAALLSGIFWLSTAEWNNSVAGFLLISALGAVIGGIGYLAGATWVLIFLRVYVRLPTVYLYEFRMISRRDTWVLVVVLMSMAILGVAFALSTMALFFDWGLAWTFGSPMLGQFIAVVLYCVDFVEDEIDEGNEDCCF